MVNLLERSLRHDRILTAIGLLLVNILAWAWLLAGAGMPMNALEMTRHGLTGMAPTSVSIWTPGYALLMFSMWWIMMIAMMIPSATPIILLASALNRRSKAMLPPFGSSGLFAAGYLLVWGAFSTLATSAQWWMQSNGWLNSMLVSDNLTMSGIILIITGLWQFSPLKQACLLHCRSPVEFLTRHRRDGNWSALYMGFTHGRYCLGCCWFLMLLLFVGGVMNLYWIIGITIYVWIEKYLPAGVWISRSIGALLCFWGIALLWPLP